ncbi:MAG TPA: phospholipase D-like domain-containing protein [Candidatus Limnocylindrales bacterium]|nr:phospholipase D-like domain-containing protein [Candidatus Limnocylindrales bacterium]
MAGGGLPVPGKARPIRAPRRPWILLASAALSAILVLSPIGAGVASADAILSGPTFNIPIGTVDQQNPILNKLKYAIDHTYSGQTIRMAFFSLTVQSFADKLIAAHKRGVNVRLIQDDHEIGPMWKQIVSVLGSNTTKRSWAVVCHRSCYSDEEPSYMHAKFYMFSKSAGVPLIVMITSANPTWTQARVGWNDMYTITRNSTIYSASRTYFEQMTAGAVQDAKGDQSVGVPINKYFTATSGKYKTYYFPIGGAGPDADPMYGVMSNIRCNGTASGYGSNGHTTIKIAMYQWAALRVRLAEKLWDLDNTGCIVEVIYNPGATDKEVLAALKKPGGKYGGIKVTPAYDDANKDGILDHFLHHKFMLINGIYAGDTSVKMVFTGSANWTNTALHYGNEISLKIIDSSVYSAYLAQYGRVYAWASKLPPPPPPSPTPGPTGTPRPTGTPGPTGTPSPTTGPTTTPTPTGTPTPTSTLAPTDEPSATAPLPEPGVAMPLPQPFPILDGGSAWGEWLQADFE